MYALVSLRSLGLRRMSRKAVGRKGRKTTRLPFRPTVERLDDRVLMDANGIGVGLATETRSETDTTTAYVASEQIPGDANQDGRFDYGDLVQVLNAGRYLSGEPATWSEGDWNVDGVFDSLDVAHALAGGNYADDAHSALVPWPDRNFDRANVGRVPANVPGALRGVGLADPLNRAPVNLPAPQPVAADNVRFVNADGQSVTDIFQNEEVFVQLETTRLNVNANEVSEVIVELFGAGTGDVERLTLVPTGDHGIYRSAGPLEFEVTDIDTNATPDGTLQVLPDDDISIHRDGQWTEVSFAQDRTCDCVKLLVVPEPDRAAGGARVMRATFTPRANTRTIDVKVTIPYRAEITCIRQTKDLHTCQGNIDISVKAEWYDVRVERERIGGKETFRFDCEQQCNGKTRTYTEQVDYSARVVGPADTPIRGKLTVTFTPKDCPGDPWTMIVMVDRADAADGIDDEASNWDGDWAENGEEAAAGTDPMNPNRFPSR